MGAGCLKGSSSQTPSSADAKSKAMMTDTDLFYYKEMLEERLAELNVGFEENSNLGLGEGLETVGLLGCGGFGYVDLVKNKTGETYAKKTLFRGNVVKAGMERSIIDEKYVMLMMDSPFILQIYATYVDSHHFYFLLEASLGGELYSTYNRLAFHGKEGHAKFYVAGITLGLEHMHELKIIYRGCNPENVLLSRTGHVKLADFGLSKYSLSKTFTPCGVPDYFSPEMITRIGHDEAVDWWSLGILTFELLAGHPPFEAASPFQIYEKIMAGIDKTTFPTTVPAAATSFTKALLKKDPSKRLAMRNGGSNNMKTSEWLSNIDWASLENGSADPPYLPKVESMEDLSNFYSSSADKPAFTQYSENARTWHQDFAWQRGGPNPNLC